LIEKGMMIKHAVMKNFSIKHPFNDDLSFLYGTIFYGSPLSREAGSRNVCIFAEGEVDRSPTGTGVSARMALHFLKGEIKINQPMVIESIIGSKFTGKVLATAKFGQYEAVIPLVEGDAFITGKNTFYINPNDPLKNGFILRSSLSCFDKLSTTLNFILKSDRALSLSKCRGLTIRLQNFTKSKILFERI